ncbi:hypothetical protein RJT34_10442 [Clitoria ternatea]|uniref:Uncharacterized protein n=1 Tax=Clitoria ternatea TaxID=43366 RepID=A0AAN9K9Z1_CLITE
MGKLPHHTITETLAKPYPAISVDFGLGSFILQSSGTILEDELSEEECDAALRFVERRRMGENLDTKKFFHCWANPQMPFALPFLNSPPQLHKSITTVADNFIGFIHSLASQNPILNKILSLPSQFHTLCNQIQCSNRRNVTSLSAHNFAAVLPGDSVAGVVVANGVMNFLNIYNTLLIVRLVLTWFPNTPPSVVSPLSTLCDPYLNIFRGLIPPLGGTLDLSPILAFLVLNAFTSTAAAIPAELPVTEQSQQGVAAPLHSTNVTTSQKKWMRRLHSSREHVKDPRSGCSDRLREIETISAGKDPFPSMTVGEQSILYFFIIDLARASTAETASDSKMKFKQSCEYCALSMENENLTRIHTHNVTRAYQKHD